MLSPSTNIEEIIENLIKQGSSEAKLAKEVGVTQPTINRWRAKKTPNNFIALRKLAVIARVSLDELLGGSEERTPKLNPEVQRMINRFENIMTGIKRSGEPQKRLNLNSTFLALVETQLDILEQTLDAVRMAHDRGQRIKLVKSKTSKLG